MRIFTKIIFIVMVLCASLSSVRAWDPSPPPPPLPLPSVEGNASITNTGRDVGPFPISFPFVDYLPGQIDYPKLAFQELVRDLRDQLGSNIGMQWPTEDIIIEGLADTLLIDNYERIWAEMPAEVRPSEPRLVTNKLIAIAWAVKIRNALAPMIADVYPQTPTTTWKSGLPVGGQNRGVRVLVTRIPTQGIDLLGVEPWLGN